jgi:hypothetical protein
VKLASLRSPVVSSHSLPSLLSLAAASDEDEARPFSRYGGSACCSQRSFPFHSCSRASRPTPPPPSYPPSLPLSGVVMHHTFSMRLFHACCDSCCCCPCCPLFVFVCDASIARDIEDSVRACGFSRVGGGSAPWVRTSLGSPVAEEPLSVYRSLSESPVKRKQGMSPLSALVGVKGVGPSPRATGSVGGGTSVGQGVSPRTAASRGIQGRVEQSLNEARQVCMCACCWGARRGRVRACACLGWAAFVCVSNLHRHMPQQLCVLDPEAIERHPRAAYLHVIYPRLRNLLRQRDLHATSPRKRQLTDEEIAILERNRTIVSPLEQALLFSERMRLERCVHGRRPRVVRWSLFLAGPHGNLARPWLQVATLISLSCCIRCTETGNMRRRCWLAARTFRRGSRRTWRARPSRPGLPFGCGKQQTVRTVCSVKSSGTACCVGAVVLPRVTVFSTVFFARTPPRSSLLLHTLALLGVCVCVLPRVVPCVQVGRDHAGTVRGVLAGRTGAVGTGSDQHAADGVVCADHSVVRLPSGAKPSSRLFSLLSCCSLSLLLLPFEVVVVAVC